ncbi:MAG: 3-dehydroquinate dehydratase [Bacteriovoracaceae bacterium]|nr:3-dehydroquinate dehydratase [Bacteriovoracaceae bacterium]
MKKIIIINGPNLNFLGKREPDIYGALTLAEIIKYTSEKIKNLPLEVEWFQSNQEGDIVQKIQQYVGESCLGLIINPAGYAHTSVSIHDALKMINFYKIEVHLSNLHSREEFRQVLLTARAVNSIISGLGQESYYVAIMALLQQSKT